MSPIIEKKCEKWEPALTKILTENATYGARYHSESMFAENLKDLIRSSLQEVEEETRKEIVGKIEGLKKLNKEASPADEIERVDEQAYNAALSDLLTLIQKK